MATEDDPAVLRIGELARRVAVSQELLRAWERRYGLLKPARSAAGFRLYTGADEQRVRRMQAHLAGGLAAAEAARAALDEDDRAAAPAGEPAAGEPSEDVAVGLAGARTGGELRRLAQRLRRALDELDEPAAQQVLDRLLA